MKSFFGGKFFKRFLKGIIPNAFVRQYRLMKAVRSVGERECPLCGYIGRFYWYGAPPRIDAECGNCGSLERHRLYAIANSQGFFSGISSLSGRVLHFAAEPALRCMFQKSAQEYLTADVWRRADLQLNLEEISLDDASVDAIIANHVLEHLNDRRAASEVYRVLSERGVFIASVPMIDGWQETYENPNVTGEQERLKHFGQADHVRYYGQDFVDRILSAGFSEVRAFTAEGKDVVEYGLMRGEKVFMFLK